MSIEKYRGKVTMNVAIHASQTGEAVSLRNLKAQGDDYQKDISGMIAIICKAHGREFGREVTDAVAEGVLDDPVLAGLNLLDLKVFKQRAIMGRYGTDYVAPAKVIEWLRQYAEERSEMVRVQGEQDHERNKSEAKKPLHPDVLKELKALFPERKHRGSEEDYKRFRARYIAERLKNNQTGDAD